MSDDAGRNAWLANMAALGAGGGGSGEPGQMTFPAWLLLQICNRCLQQQAPLLQPFLVLMSQENPQSHMVLDLASAHWSIHGYNLQGVYWGATFRSSGSFCERINSCANQIVTVGNTSLVTIWWTSPRCSEWTKLHEVHEPQSPLDFQTKIPNIRYCHLRRLQRARWCRDGLGIDIMIYMYLCIHDILYLHDIHVRVYIHIYIHTYIYIYIYI